MVPGLVRSPLIEDLSGEMKRRHERVRTELVDQEFLASYDSQGNEQDT
jgi:hypothetical protein